MKSYEQKSANSASVTIDELDAVLSEKFPADCLKSIVTWCLSRIDSTGILAEIWPRLKHQLLQRCRGHVSDPAFL